jgi:hypothetical protein
VSENEEIQADPENDDTGLTDEEFRYLWGKRHNVLYKSELSTLYHRKRERFFDFWDRVITAIAIIGGSAAYANVGGPDAVKLAAATIAVTSTISLVFAFAARARTHAGLAQRFLELQARIVGRGERDFSESDVNEWESVFATLETQEPPTLSSLVRACQNELARARGDYGKIVPIRFWHRLTMHFFDHATTKAQKPA